MANIRDLKSQVGGHKGVGTIVQVGEGAEVHGTMASVRSNPSLGFFKTRDISAICHSAARYLTPIPNKLSSQVAAPMLCAGMTSYAALRKSNTKPGDRMVVLGTGGGVRHLVTQLAASTIQYAQGVDFLRPGGTTIGIGIPRPSMMPEQLRTSKQETVKLSKL